jgi:organic hydroperoxide reductase OsmC/OhrA
MRNGKSGKLEYNIRLLWDEESGGEAYIRNFPPLQFDMPTDFGGKSRFPCPDELFFSAIGGCLVTTFLYFKNRLELNLLGLRVSVQGTVDSVGLKGYRIKNIKTALSIEVDAEETVKAEKCAELAKEFCHLTRSLELGISIEVQHEIKTL